MQRLSLYYPVKPYAVTRVWGVVDPLYKTFGFTRHNGVDLALIEGQPVYAPFDCRVTKVGNEPEGSGLYVCLLSRGKHDFDDGRRARIEITFMHLSQTTLKPGISLAVGDLVALGGRSGRTTGSHTHLAPKRVRMTLLGSYRDIDMNDANNTFDPEPYWNGRYASGA